MPRKEQVREGIPGLFRCVPSLFHGREGKVLFATRWTREPQRRIAPKAILRFKEGIRELTRGTHGVSVETVGEELGRYLHGRQGHYGFCQTPVLVRTQTTGHNDGFGRFCGSRPHATTDQTP